MPILDNEPPEPAGGRSIRRKAPAAASYCLDRPSRAQPMRPGYRLIIMTLLGSGRPLCTANAVITFDRKIPVCILAGLAAALILTSCASDPSSSQPDSVPGAATTQAPFTVATSPGLPPRGGDMPYRYAGSVTEEHTWGNSIVADPVPAGTVGKMTPGSLLSMCRTVATCGQGDAGPTISLALITTPSSGTARADGTLVPDMNKTLGYVMVWGNQGCMPRRQLPSEGTTQTAQPALSSDCTRITVIDDVSGKYVLSLLE